MSASMIAWHVANDGSGLVKLDEMYLSFRGDKAVIILSVDHRGVEVQLESGVPAERLQIVRLRVVPNDYVFEDQGIKDGSKVYISSGNQNGRDVSWR